MVTPSLAFNLRDLGIQFPSVIRAHPARPAPSTLSRGSQACPQQPILCTDKDRGSVEEASIAGSWGAAKVSAGP